MEGLNKIQLKSKRSDSISSIESNESDTMKDMKNMNNTMNKMDKKNMDKKKGINGRNPLGFITMNDKDNKDMMLLM